MLLLIHRASFLAMMIIALVILGIAFGITVISVDPLLFLFSLLFNVVFLGSWAERMAQIRRIQL